MDPTLSCCSDRYASLLGLEAIEQRCVCSGMGCAEERPTSCMRRGHWDSRLARGLGHVLGGPGIIVVGSIKGMMRCRPLRPHQMGHAMHPNPIRGRFIPARGSN